MGSAIVVISEKRQAVLAQVLAVIAARRANGASNADLRGHLDLVEALNNLGRVVSYCRSCLVLGEGASCNIKKSAYVTCDKAIWQILVGE